MIIKDNEYKFKYTLRALFIFELITGKPFKLETVTDQYIFFYSILLANNPDCKLTFDQFIDSIDEDPNIMNEFIQLLENEKAKNNVFPSNEDGKKKF